MAVDTARKRLSALGARRPPLRRAGIPDGTIDQIDRQTITWYYGGILAGAPPSAAAIDKQLNDIIRERLETELGVSGDTTSLWEWYLEVQLGHVGQVNDLHFEWLGSFGYSSTTLQGRIKERLNTLGYTGDIDDMFFESWYNGDYF